MRVSDTGLVFWTPFFHPTLRGDSRSLPRSQFGSRCRKYLRGLRFQEARILVHGKLLFRRRNVNYHGVDQDYDENESAITQEADLGRDRLLAVMLSIGRRVHLVSPANEPMQAERSQDAETDEAEAA